MTMFASKITSETVHDSYNGSLGCTCLGYLVQFNTYRIGSICMSSPKVTKASIATFASQITSKTAHDSNSDCTGCTCLGYLVQFDTYRIGSICTSSPKVTETSIATFASQITSETAHDSNSGCLGCTCLGYLGRCNA